jgi:uncharacterized Zn finger protein
VQHLQACLVCNHPASEAVVRYRRKDDALVRCPRCGLMYANPQYTPDELVGLYQQLLQPREHADRIGP